MLRLLYRFVLRFHPPRFRDRFEAEMLLLFDDTAAARTGFWLTFDAVCSLFRQWLLRDNHWQAQSKSPLRQLAGGAQLLTSANESRFRPTALLFGAMFTVVVFVAIPSFVSYGHSSSGGGRVVLLPKGLLSQRSAVVHLRNPLAQPEYWSGLPETPAERLFMAWIQIYNTGNLQTMASFYRVHTPSDMKLTMESNVRNWFTASQQSGPIRIRSLTRIGSSRVAVIGRSEGGTLWNIVLDVHARDAGNIAGLEIWRVGSSVESLSLSD